MLGGQTSWLELSLAMSLLPSPLPGTYKDCAHWCLGDQLTGGLRGDLCSQQACETPPPSRCFNQGPWLALICLGCSLSWEQFRLHRQVIIDSSVCFWDGLQAPCPQTEGALQLNSSPLCSRDSSPAQRLDRLSPPRGPRLGLLNWTLETSSSPCWLPRGLPGNYPGVCQETAQGSARSCPGVCQETAQGPARRLPHHLSPWTDLPVSVPNICQCPMVPVPASPLTEEQLCQRTGTHS